MLVACGRMLASTKHKLLPNKCHDDYFPIATSLLLLCVTDFFNSSDFRVHSSRRKLKKRKGKERKERRESYEQKFY